MTIDAHMFTVTMAPPSSNDELPGWKHARALLKPGAVLALASVDTDCPSGATTLCLVAVGKGLTV